MAQRAVLLLVSAACILLPGCATRAHRPCSDGGDASREIPIRGTKQCIQIRDRNGQFVNNGPFVEYFPNGQKATEGEYKMGRKQGKWIEWDDRGRKVSEKYYEDGVLVGAPR